VPSHVLLVHAFSNGGVERCAECCTDRFFNCGSHFESHGYASRSTDTQSNAGSHRCTYGSAHNGAHYSTDTHPNAGSHRFTHGTAHNGTKRYSIIQCERNTQSNCKSDESAHRFIDGRDQHANDSGTCHDCTNDVELNDRVNNSGTCFECTHSRSTNGHFPNSRDWHANCDTIAHLVAITFYCYRGDNRSRFRNYNNIANCRDLSGSTALLTVVVIVFLGNVLHCDWVCFCGCHCARRWHHPAAAAQNARHRQRGTRRPEGWSHDASFYRKPRLCADGRRC
jgi:hypothetical protein